MNYDRSTMKVFLSYFKPHLGLFVLDLSCALAACIIDLTFPLVARHAMYRQIELQAFWFQAVFAGCRLL